MLLAGVIKLFRRGSAVSPSRRRPPVVTGYLAPVVFLSGLGLLLYGLYCEASLSSLF